MMRFRSRAIAGLLVIEPQVLRDARGCFFEAYHRKKFAENGLDVTFVQDNQSFSRRGVLRGLHYQLEHPQGKLVRALSGEIFDVAVDIRLGSPTFGQWAGEILSGENRRMFYLPPGFAHGFCVLSESAEVHYKCTDFYAPGDEYGIVWNDADLNIEWPGDAFELSERDRALKPLAEMRDHLPGSVGR
jgi:dTDP-4-dehydrorhamnose 3,5-epimerase